VSVEAPDTARDSTVSQILCIGIDFGTTNTCVAVKETNPKEGIEPTVTVLPIDSDASNQSLMRTLIFIPNRRESFFGKNAIDQYFDHDMEGRFFQSIKKLLPNPEFNGTSVFGVHLGIEALIARFLMELKKRIEKKVGSIEGIPIHMGRPARYSLDPECEALAVKRFMRAIELAGFSHVKLIEEPTAAAESSRHVHPEDTLVLVCDLGGGTSDFTLFRSKKNAGIETLSVHGVPVAGDSLDSDFFRTTLNPHFGSEIRYQRLLSSNVLTLPSTFVKILPKWHHHAFLRERSTWEFILSLRRELVDERQKPVLENLITLVEENVGYKLHQQVESMKIALSKSTETNFDFRSYPIEISFPVENSAFEAMIEPSVRAIEAAAQETVALVGVDPNEVQILQLTGGTAKVPLIRKRLQSLFPNAIISESEAFTAVAEGLALAQ